MQALTSSLEFFVRPPRTYSANLLYSHKEELEHFDNRPFKVISFDGVALAGTLLRLRQPSDKAVVYLHSHASSRYEGAQIVKSCIEHGYNLVLFDCRASGESQGANLTFGSKEKIDLLYVLLKCTLEFNFHQFVLWGRSLGCTNVLAFYEELVSKSGRFLNQRLSQARKNGTHLRPGAIRSLHEKANAFPNKLFPERINIFVEAHLTKFLNENIPGAPQPSGIEFVITGLVLDSPYESITSFLDENIKKRFNFLISGVLSTCANMYLKSWMEKHLQIDITADQNIDMVQRVNINTVFIVSDKDEIVSMEKFDNLVGSFAKRCFVKAKPRVLNSHQAHGAVRAKYVVEKAFEQLAAAANSMNYYRLEHVLVQLQEKEGGGQETGVQPPLDQGGIWAGEYQLLSPSSSLPENSPKSVGSESVRKVSNFEFEHPTKSAFSEHKHDLLSAPNVIVSRPLKPSLADRPSDLPKFDDFQTNTSVTSFSTQVTDKSVTDKHSGSPVI